jgi:hypothetical protein
VTQLLGGYGMPEQTTEETVTAPENFAWKE